MLTFSTVNIFDSKICTEPVTIRLLYAGLLLWSSQILVLQGDPKMHKHDAVLFVLSFVAILEPLSLYFDSIFFGFIFLVQGFLRSRYNLAQQSVSN